jgi:HAD superfamily hydrolase (TIGR01509 family)
MKALIFDCDGVLADTERDGHRVAFNEAFRRMGLPFAWDVPEYGELLSIAGGKERMRRYFDRNGWPERARDRDGFIRELHDLKTAIYRQIIEEDRLPLRPGVARLIDEAIRAGVVLAICSTSDARGVTLLAHKLLGSQRASRFSTILAGDVVANKKPDPEIYLLASERLGVPPDECVVVEDSRNGLLAAKAAGMICIVTTSHYTERESFVEADAVFPELGDPPSVLVHLGDLMRLATDRRNRI